MHAQPIVLQNPVISTNYWEITILTFATVLPIPRERAHIVAGEQKINLHPVSRY